MKHGLKEQVKEGKLTAATALKKLEKRAEDNFAMISRTAKWLVEKAKKPDGNAARLNLKEKETKT